MELALCGAPHIASSPWDEGNVRYHEMVVDVLEGKVCRKIPLKQSFSFQILASLEHSIEIHCRCQSPTSAVPMVTSSPRQTYGRHACQELAGKEPLLVGWSGTAWEDDIIHGWFTTFCKDPKTETCR